MTQEVFDAMLAEAKAAHETAKEVFKNEPGPVDDAAKLLSDMVAIGGHIGLTANTLRSHANVTKGLPNCGALFLFSIIFLPKFHSMVV